MLIIQDSLAAGLPAQPPGASVRFTDKLLLSKRGWGCGGETKSGQGGEGRPCPGLSGLAQGGV